MLFGESIRSWAGRLAIGAACVGGLGLAGAAQADSCRDWTEEHWAIKSEVVRLYLAGAPQEGLDAAVFELLQREAYMTSCDPRTVVEPVHQVGWRLVDRDPDEYAGAVIEGLLADAGLDPSLDGLFSGSELQTPARVSPSPGVAHGSVPAVVNRPAAQSTQRR